MLAMLLLQCSRDKRRPNLIGLPEATHQLKRALALATLLNDSIQAKKCGDAHVGYTMHPHLFATMRVHGGEERQQVSLRGSRKLDRDVNVGHTEGVDRTGFIGQRIPWVVMKPEINDSRKSRFGNAAELGYRWLAGRTQLFIYRAKVADT